MGVKGLKGVLFIGLCVLISKIATAADNGDVVEGEKLYVAHCKMCHGNNSVPQASNESRPDSRSPAEHLAMHKSSDSSVTDVPFNIAFAPPFGPNLRGVYMRPAGTAKGFEYSPAFLKALKGMEWNDAALDVWLTNTQAWVPGVYMYFKHSDPEVRRKIIEYLKANP
jgi:cytochrome c2